MSSGQYNVDLTVQGNIIFNLPSDHKKNVKKVRNKISSNFKKQVKGRDGMCMCCGETDKPLEVHHIMPVSLYDDLECDMGNVVSLCQSCHGRYHKEYGEGDAVCFGEFMKRYGKRYP